MPGTCEILIGNVWHLSRVNLWPQDLYPMFIDSHLTKRHAVVLHVSTAGLYGWLSLEVIFVPQPTASKHSSSTLDHFDVGMSDPRDEKRVQDKAVDRQMTSWYLLVGVKKTRYDKRFLGREDNKTKITTNRGNENSNAVLAIFSLPRCDFPVLS